MNTAVKKPRVEHEQHEIVRPSAFRKPTGELPAQKGAEPEANRAQASLLASAAELVAVLEAFDVVRDHGGSRPQTVADASEKPRPRGPEPTGTPTIIRANAAAHSVKPQTSANERAAEARKVEQHPRTSPDVGPLRAWREFFAQFRTPNARYLVITANDQASMYEFFRRELAGVDTVEVRMDRRLRERRPSADPVAVEPPRPDRRSRPEVDAELRASGFAIVRSLARPDVRQATLSRAEQGRPSTLGRAPAAVEASQRSPFRRDSSA